MSDPTPSTANRDFGVLLALAYVTFMDQLDEAMAAAGHRGFEGGWFGFVLRLLTDGPLSLRRLADHLDMSSPGALKIVDAMVADGYLERVADPADGRVRLIGLTSRGHDALATARRFHARFEAQLVTDLGAADAAAARTALAAIVERGSGKVPKLFRQP